MGQVLLLWYYLFAALVHKKMLHTRLLQACSVSLVKSLARTPCSVWAVQLPRALGALDDDANRILQHRFRHTTAQVPDTLDVTVLCIYMTANDNRSDASTTLLSPSPTLPALRPSIETCWVPRYALM